MAFIKEERLVKIKKDQLYVFLIDIILWDHQRVFRQIYIMVVYSKISQKYNFNKDNHPKAGDLISLGSLVQTQWVQKNDKVKVEIEKIGNVEVKFN